MRQYEKLPVSVLEAYPMPDTEEVHKRYAEAYRNCKRKVVVLDDDPTGVQTVHGIDVYTDLSYGSLREGMESEDNMFFLLTNSRSFTAIETERVHRELAQRTAEAGRECHKEFLVVSRGDSTLRGHYPLEMEVLREALEAETGHSIHGQILCPYFQEGGRYTIDSVHYVREGEWLVPSGQTEFALDKTFGYRASHLGEYIEEKSGGRYLERNCIYITLALLRQQRVEEITALLRQAEHFQPIVVDAIAECDIETFAFCLMQAMRTGREFLIRSAAAVPKVLGNISSRPLLTREELTGEAVTAQAGESGSRDVEGAVYGGIVLIGSHVNKTTLQLEALREAKTPAEFIEFDVNTCMTEGGLEAEKNRIIAAAEHAMTEGRTAVVYTSRTLLAPKGATGEELLQLSVNISDAVTGVVAGLHRKPKFLIAKGGITSSDVGTKALGVKKALVLGQAQPGVPVWRTGQESKFPGLSYIIFPGNVGDTDTLRKIVEMLA